VKAGARAASDPSALALIGPLHSAAVAETVEATAPAGLALLAPLATWVGVTRDDEPGCDDAARHRGTVLRLVARDSVVAERIAARLRAQGKTALVVAGEHAYGRQLDEQLAAAGLPRTDDRKQADVVVLAGLEGEAEIGRAAALSPLPVIAFDGVQGAPGRDPGRAAGRSDRSAPRRRPAGPVHRRGIGSYGGRAGERRACPRSSRPRCHARGAQGSGRFDATETPSSRPYGYGERTTAGGSTRTKPSRSYADRGCPSGAVARSRDWLRA
jgi:hypothetical protein